MTAVMVIVMTLTRVGSASQAGAAPASILAGAPTPRMFT